MSQHQVSTNVDTDKKADLQALKALLDRLDISTSLHDQSTDTAEINSILSALKDHLENSTIKDQLKSDKHIANVELPNIMIHFCKVSIAFSDLLLNYSLFSTVMVQLWNATCENIQESLEKGLVSATECYETTMNGLSTAKSFAYLGGEEVEPIFVFYIRIFLRLLKESYNNVVVMFRSSLCLSKTPVLSVTDLKASQQL